MIASVIAIPSGGLVGTAIADQHDGPVVNQGDGSTYETIQDAVNDSLTEIDGAEITGNVVSEDGDGTETEPYVVTNVSELQAMEDDLDAHYELGNDIDASDTEDWNNGTGFAPIDDDDSAFNGTFDGQGHTIFNLSIDRDDEGSVGLFGHTTEEAVIENVRLEDVDVNGGTRVGGLVGENLGEISESSATGTINATSSYVGVLVGRNAGDITESWAGGIVNGSGNRNGGLLGGNVGTVRDSHANGTVIGHYQTGGLAGTMSNGSVIQSYATGDVEGEIGHTGGLVGHVIGGTINRSYATGDVTDDVTVESEDESDDSVGGLVGYNRGTVEESRANANVTGVSRVGGLIGYSDNTVRDSYANGTVNGSTSVGGLVGRNDPGDVSGSYSMASVEGQSEVGGLVGQNRGGSVTGSHANGSVAGTDQVGGLVGRNAGGSVTESYANGSVAGTSQVGGIVGGNHDSQISMSFANGSIQGESRVGGLVGENSEASDVAETYADSAVEGNESVGGLVGYHAGGDSTVAESYATGTVDGSERAGGLIGNVTASAATTASYWDTEATTADVGIGDGDGSSSADGLETADMTGPSSITNMAGLEFFGTWVATEGYPAFAWETEGLRLDPVDVSLDDLDGTGTESDPYVVTNASELQAMENDLDAHYELGDDIDASGTEHWNNGTGFDPIGVDDSAFNGTFDGGGHAISDLTIDRPGKKSVGLFHQTTGDAAIENVGLEDVDVEGLDTVGALVGESNGGVTASHVSGNVESSNIWVGGLIGRNRGSVNKSYSTADIQGGDEVGGLVGINHGSVTESYASGDVEGEDLVGGLIGNHFAGDASKTYAVGEVSAVDGSNAGGLAGDGDGSVTESYWDENSTGQPTSATGGTALSTEQMTGEAAADNMDGFDFENTWATTDDYPALVSLEGGGEDDDEESPPAMDFQVVDDDLPETAGQAHNVTVTATIENVGDHSGEQTITYELVAPDDVDELVAPDDVVLSVEEDLELSAGETDTVELEYQIPPGLAPDTYEQVLETENDSIEADLFVEQTEPDVEVSDYFLDPDPEETDFVVGDTLEAKVPVANQGDRSGEFAVEFLVDEDVVDEKTVEVGAGEVETVDLAFEFSAEGQANVSVNGVDPVQIDVETVPGSPADDGSSSSSSPSLSSDAGSESDSVEVIEDPEELSEGDLPADVTPVRAERAELTADNESGEAMAEFTDESPVERVTLEDTVEGEVTVTEFEGAPDDLPGTAAAAVDIAVPEGTEDTSATIRSRMSQERVAELEAGAEDLRILRLVDGTWEALETTLVEQTDEAVVLEAETPGFSSFAVSAVSAPDSVIELDSSVVTSGEAVELSATDSTDEFGEIAAYEWTVGDQQLEGETASVILDEPGQYDVELTVTNDAGESASATAALTVEADATGTPAPTSTAPPETAETVTTESPGLDGFGAVVALLALLGSVIVARLRSHHRR